jgi:penicillin-binding protein 2
VVSTAVDPNTGRRDLPRSGPRFAAFAVVALWALAILAARLFDLQVLHGALDADRTVAAGQVEVAIPAPRGLIFDRDGSPLVANVPSWTVAVRPGELPPAARPGVLGTVAALVERPPDAMAARLEAYTGSEFDLVPVARGVARDAALIIHERSEELPGVVVEVEAERRYLDGAGAEDGALLAHVLGYTGPVDADDLASLESAGYLPDDVNGRAGIEATHEELLRGRYGSELVERDAAGRTVKVVDTLRQPTPGTNIVLSIDADLQRMATDALRWGMDVAGVSQGVTVVMNPQTGEILAMVSLPSYDNNDFAAGITPERYAAYLEDPNLPLRNHAIEDIYPPGSTFKLVTALASLEEGVTTADQLWQTHACYQIPGAPDGQCLYDWNRQGFGQLDVVDAFALSSDTFFYQMAVSLGVDRLAEWAHELGFGEPSGIGLPGEAAGIVASTRWAQEQGRPTVFTGELAQAGIGQNVIAVTPLQLLNAYNAIANGGNLMKPMIVLGEADAAGQLVRRFEPEVLRRVAASDANLGVMRMAAREVVASGHAYNIRDLPLPGALSGKTGTAEFGEPLESGELPYHSWFVAFVPSSAGATDAQLAVVTFTYAANVQGNVSTEVVKFFLQKLYGIEGDFRLDPRTVSLLEGN